MKNFQGGTYKLARGGGEHPYWRVSADAIGGKEYEKRERKNGRKIKEM
jgi:hypothetical protein